MRRKAAHAALLACAAVAGCAPTVSNHGFAPQVAELSEIEPGMDTRGSVVRRLGRPSAYSAYDGDVWYYIASRVESFAFYRPRVVDRTVVAVRFDENGLVTEVNSYGVEDGRIIDLVTNTTPTYGRELSVLQQIFGNVGRFDAGQVLGGGAVNVPGGTTRPR